MIYQRPSFARRYKKLSRDQQARVNAAVVRFEAAVGRPHAHAGIGLRPFGRFLEFRAGLDLRILALPQRGDFFLVCVGNHDQVRAFMKGQ
jgi:hypothetical protein